MKFTIFGATGFIGAAQLRYLRAQGHEVLTPGREETADARFLAGTDFGHAIYAIGLTADFRRKPIETLRAHTGVLAELLALGKFSSFTYLSSTRVYGCEGGPTHEEAPLTLSPAKPDHLYNASKIAGESLVLALDRPDYRVVRLSNVYGADFTSENFLTSVLRQAVRGRIRLHTSLASEKDYIALSDVVDTLPAIALAGRHRLYNLAAGENVSHGEICDRLARLCQADIRVGEGAPIVRCPPIDISRLGAEFDFRPASLLTDMTRLVALSRAELETA
ncbi:MAG: SDR family oxidoreductase [Alphaproteobacteria bacterium]